MKRLFKHYFTVDHAWLDRLSLDDREVVLLRAKLDARSYMLRLSVALNTSLIAGLVVNLIMSH